MTRDLTELVFFHLCQKIGDARGLVFAILVTATLMLAACGGADGPTLSGLTSSETDTATESIADEDTQGPTLEQAVKLVQISASLELAAGLQEQAGETSREQAQASGDTGNGQGSISLSGTTLYVAASGGSDSNLGTYTRPLANVQRAIDLARAGDTVVLLPGIYPVSTPIRVVNKVASSELPLTIIGQGTVVLRATAAGVPGIWRGIVEIDNSSYITVKHIAVENSSFFGFRIQDSQNITLQNNRSTISLASGIYSRKVVGLKILNNDISRFCDKNSSGSGPGVSCQEGITLSAVDGFAVTGNSVHDAPQQPDVGPGGGEGIDIKNGSKNGVVSFNSVWNIVQLAIYIDGWSEGVSNVEVFGNKICCSYMGIAVASELGGVVSDISIHDNIIHSVGVDGIVVAKFKAGANGDGRRSRIKIYNNTVVNAGIKEAKPPFYSLWSVNGFPDWGTGINIESMNVSEIEVFDNILHGNKTAAIKVPDALRSQARVTSNLIWPKTAQNVTNAFDGQTSMVSKPGFVSTATGDWHLAAGSPAIGVGSVAVKNAVDAERVPRRAGPSDLGALTYRGQ